MSDRHPFDALRDLCRKLRGADGCPWDRAQTLESLRPYIIEEAYEVVDAIDSDDPVALAGELGDLLFQITLVAELAEERGWFDALQVCNTVRDKMIRRHPHVFSDAVAKSADDVVRNWEQIKRRETGRRGALAGVPRQLPALLKSLRMTEKAAALGFDWERVDDVVEKLREEVDELSSELAGDTGDGREERVQDELGDVLFVIANLARQLRIDPEAALQAANDKFARRFAAMEQLADERGLELRALSLVEQNRLWEEVKRGKQV